MTNSLDLHVWCWEAGNMEYFFVFSAIPNISRELKITHRVFFMLVAWLFLKRQHNLSWTNAILLKINLTYNMVKKWLILEWNNFSWNISRSVYLKIKDKNFPWCKRIIKCNHIITIKYLSIGSKWQYQINSHTNHCLKKTLNFIFYTVLCDLECPSKNPLFLMLQVF